MDALIDPNIETVVGMTCSQIGKSEILNNIIGYYIDQDPSPILVVQPTLEIAKAWSKDRFAPMLRDTPCLKGRVRDPRSRSSDNTTLHKTFLGGHITVAGSNSAASLRARPIRIVLCDDVDSFGASAGSEGDPVSLAFKRSTTFWNRRKAIFSTPTIKGFSRIERAYEESDMRKYYVPCPHCGEFQILQFGNVRWPKDKPKKAVYHCEKCDGEITDAHKIRMVREGQWRATKESDGVAGFWLNELYSPWVSFGEMAVRFLEAKKNRETLKVFVNTALAETWEEEGESVNDQSLFGRREKYGPEIPMAAGILTAGVDVQDNRLEVEVVGWGRGEESWSMDYKTFYGSPAQSEVWRDLDEYLLKSWKHESGISLKVASCCIDTGGHHTKEAYAFVKPRQIRRVFAVKGINQPGRPIVGRPSMRNEANVNLFPVGSDTAKESIYARLKIEEFGPSYMHFPLHYDEEYFKQLTGEKVITKYVKGFPVRVWVKARARNDALDARVYAMAALAILNVNLDHAVDRLQQPKKEEDNRNKIPPINPLTGYRKGEWMGRGNWMSGYPQGGWIKR
jgi:phage terminase large subunit GpA-like protein